jgi:phage terminase large subunit-like protein
VITMASDEELEKFVNDVSEKVVTQEDKIDSSVEENLGQMGWLWDVVIKKLSDDSTCFLCKKTMDKEEKPYVVHASKTEQGIVAFISLCKECHDKELEKQTKTEQTKTG